jgi:hypothetical protein
VNISYKNPPANPEQTLRLIARVPTGRQALSKFLNLYRSGQVRLEHYEPDLLARLRAAVGEGQPVGACFINDGVTGKIHYDPDAPLGVLAPFFVHEMVHAADASLWQASGSKQSRQARDRLMLRAETLAFEIQHRFVRELRAVDGAFDSFLRQEQQRVRVLHERLTEREIADLYGFEH